MGEREPRGPAARLARVIAPVECPGCGLPDVRWCDECEAPWWEPPLRCESGAPRLDAIAPPLPVWSITGLDGSAHALVAAWKDAGRLDLTAMFVAAASRAATAIAPALTGALARAPRIVVVPCPARPQHTRRRGQDLPVALARAVAAGLAGAGANARVRPVLRAAAGSSRGAGDRGRWRATVPRTVRGLEAEPVAPTLLVDDVVTTGATLARAAAALAHTPLVPVGALVLASAPGFTTSAPSALL